MAGGGCQEHGVGECVGLNGCDGVGMVDGETPREYRENPSWMMFLNGLDGVGWLGRG
jgi:hypothetical protein